jgi:hypothetical protein
MPARRGSNRPESASVGDCRSIDLLTDVSRHTILPASVTPLSVASATLFGAQLKFSSHWNTIRSLTRLR